jgi:hypothetical protein
MEGKETLKPSIQFNALSEVTIGNTMSVAFDEPSSVGQESMDFVRTKSTPFPSFGQFLLSTNVTSTQAPSCVQSVPRWPCGTHTVATTPRYDLKLWIGDPFEGATYLPR